ncbi:hypothetical protein [Streptomyces sp. NPDC002209]|uniref:hypothetical protein n=1 Tax=Streptomyces sp. NPDC002209 TaxID=3364638 RepID=UPI0036C42187
MTAHSIATLRTRVVRLTELSATGFPSSLAERALNTASTLAGSSQAAIDGVFRSTHLRIAIVSGAAWSRRFMLKANSRSAVRRSTTAM